jgi:hypothetical protein
VFAYFGHHKCASQWIAGILWRIAGETGLKTFGVYDRLTPAAAGPLRQAAPRAVPFPREQLRERVDATEAQLVGCVTADRFQAEILRPTRAFHVIRDPRDIVVSAYFSHRNSHPIHELPMLEEHRKVLTELSFDDGLLLEMEFSTVELEQIGDWDYTQESILELKMEDVTRYPYDAFLHIFAHLGLLTDDEPVVAVEQVKAWTARLGNRLSRRRALARLRHLIPATGEIVLGAVYEHRFETKAMGRTRGVEDQSHHYRKGVAGDWVNHFKPQHARAFDERFGDLLIRLGYETGSDWLERV